jgi:hypothetical protein
MSVTFEDALSTLEAMFPQWDRETLGAYQLLQNNLDGFASCSMDLYSKI